MAITAATLTQLIGSGTSTFNGAINTSAIGGVNLTGSTFAFNATTTTAGGGGFTLVNSGTATFALDADLSVDGAFSQSGSGSVQPHKFTTTGGTISSRSSDSPDRYGHDAVYRRRSDLYGSYYGEPSSYVECLYGRIHYGWKCRNGRYAF